MPQKALSALSRALFDTDMITARILLAVAEFLWGALLFWPGDTFGRPTYSLMAMVLPEEAWAALFMCSSVFQMWIITTEEFHSRPARIFAAYNAALWAFIIFAMLFAVYPPPAAISGEIALACAAFWIWFRPHLISKWIAHARKTVPLC